MAGFGEFAELLRHRWDPVILSLLTERPRRRRDLTQEVVDLGGERVSDGVLSLALKRLQAEGMVIRKQAGARHVEYHATPSAVAVIDRLRRLSEIAAGLQGNECCDQSAS